jgi:hypothetical protein
VPDDLTDHVAGLRILAECIERGLAVSGKDEVLMLVRPQDAADIRAAVAALDARKPA